MQPVKMTIPGSFWDSQIYSGRLYCFGIGGEMLVYDWDKMVHEIGCDNTLRLAAECAFLRSDFLYGDDIGMVFEDAEVAALIQRKFWDLASRQLVVSQEDMRNCLIRCQDNPFPFPHTDSELFRNVMYCSSDEGVYHASCNKRNKNPVSSRAKRIWDGPTLGLSASYGTLAAAAGENGLFELDLYERYVLGADPKRVAAQYVDDVNRVSRGCFGSSHSGGGVLVDYQRVVRDEDLGMPAEDGRERYELAAVLSEEQIFGASGYSWGVQDKIYQCVGSQVSVVAYAPWLKVPEERIRHIGSLDIEKRIERVVSACAAPFGVVIETDNALIVVPSDGTPALALDGEPVSWRVFPRSTHYENHLHVVRDDALEVYSFNHDYFVKQNSKKMGSTFWSRGRTKRK